MTPAAKAAPARRLPVRGDGDCAFDVPVQRRRGLSWLCSSRVSAAPGGAVDMVGRPVWEIGEIWENGEKQTIRNARLHRSAGLFWNNMPGEDL